MQFGTALTFNGQTEAAFNFYKSVFEVEFSSPMVKKKNMFPELEDSTEGERVLHVAIEIDGYYLIGNDSFDVAEDFTKEPQAYSIFLAFDNPEQAETIFTRLSQKGNVVVPLATQPWGDHFGHLVDQFGIKWDLKVG